MKYKINIIKLVYLVIFLSFFIIFLPFKEGRSIENEDIFLDIDVDFELLEYSVKRGYLQDSDSIYIDLPTESWKIKDIELNFTNIDFATDIKTIEDNISHNTYKRVYNKNPAQYLFGQAVQVKILDPSTIYGVYTYGYNYLAHPGTPQIQIRGYNTTNNTPNSSILASVNLNITESPSWHLQNFSSPIFLGAGNYFLVLDGISIPAYATNDAGFYWAYNSINTYNPDLFISEFIDQWSIGSSGSPFLYKLIQKVNVSIYPEEINMTAQFNGNSYSVSNGNTRGKGYLKKNNINFHGNKKQVDIKVKNNKSETLKFNVTYDFNIFNDFNATGSVNIKYNNSNEWIINPAIIRHTDNHTVKFNYPNSWSNLKVFKNQQDITSDILNNPINNFIIIPNNSIENNVEWEITANSPNIGIAINAPKIEFNAGQELRFSLGSNPLPGNYIFKLFDPLDLEIYQFEKEIPLDNNTFSYKIPKNAIAGDYVAYIFWNNATDAGVQSQVFSILNNNIQTSPMDLSLFLTIGLIIVGGVVIGFSGYITVKKIESKHRDKMKLFLEKCNDVLNLQYIIVLDPKTGIDLYAQSFEKKEIEPTLIAGFLQAIHNFGVEVIEGAKQSKTIKVEYKDSIVIMSDFVNVRLITIMKSNPSKNFLYSIESLAYHIYKYYSKLIDNFKGILEPFRGIKRLVESDLNVSFRYPLTVSVYKNIKLSQNEKEMIKKALNFMKENDFKYFYTVYLLPDNTCKPKDYETILQLIKKGIFRPIELNND